MADPSTISPPPGGDHNRGDATLAMQTSLSLVAFAFVGARIYARSVVLKCFGIDDGLTIIAAACNFSAALMTLLIACSSAL